MGFSRQEYWSGLPFPSPGDLPNPGVELGSPAFQADALTSEPPGKERVILDILHICFIVLSSQNYMNNKRLDLVGEGKGGMILEDSIETYILPYVKQITSGSLMHDTGYSNRCSGTTWSDRVGRQVGGQFRMEGTYVYL